MVGPAVALGCGEALPAQFKGFLKGRGYRLRDYPREVALPLPSFDILNLGRDRVLSFAGNPLNDDLRALGLEVLEPDLSQFTLAGLAARSLTFELERSNG